MDNQLEDRGCVMEHGMQLEAMRVFKRVAELASFSAAADQLGLTRSRVSAVIQQLEAHLGTRLLHRTTRRVQLTQDGQVFFERSRDLLDDVDELQAYFRTDSEVLRGRIRVDMPQAMASEAVLPRLPDLLGRHPLLEIELSCTDRRVDLVREGFDCVVRVGELGDANLIARPLGHYRMINCASPAYLAGYGTPRSPADLVVHRLVVYQTSLGGPRSGFEYRDEAGKLCRVAMAGSLSVNSTAAYDAACMAGLGIIQVPAVGMREHLDQARLVEVLPHHCAPPMPVSLLYANRRHLPRRVQVFMHWLGEVVRQRLQD
jgi:DNA-binding transcriptional LysR family regulator